MDYGPQYASQMVAPGTLNGVQPTPPMGGQMTTMAPPSLANTLTSEEQLQYPSWWTQAVPGDQAVMPAATAKSLMECSGLSRESLHDIWNLFVPMGQTYLQWEDFIAVMRSIAFLQQGYALSPELPNNLPQVLARFPFPINFPPPNQGGASSLPLHDPWVISEEDRREYVKVFTKYDHNHDGLVDANDAKEIFSTSDLPRETLFHIWDLADRKKRGQLDLGEFIVASHLVVTAGLSGGVPSSLPPSLEAEFDPPDIQKVEEENKHPSGSAPVPGTKVSPYSAVSADPHLTSTSPISPNEADFDFQGKPRTRFSECLDPCDLIAAVIEGDRSMAQFLKTRTDGLHDDFIELKTLNEALVNELKDQREELTNQLTRQQNLEEELNQLRTQYTQLYSLRKEVLQQSNSLSGQISLIKTEKEYLERFIAEAKLDIAHATGLSGDLNKATKAVNQSLSAVNGGRQAMAEALKNFEETYRTEEAQVADLSITLKRLEAQKARQVESNLGQMERVNQGLQDHAVLSMATEHDNRALVQHAGGIFRKKDDKSVILSQVRSRTSEITPGVGRSPPAIAGKTISMMTSPPRPTMSSTSRRDPKGLPHAPTIPQRPEMKAQWVSFRSEED